MSDPATQLAGLAFVASGFDSSGGVEGQARRLARSIAGRGIPVTYLTTSPSGDRRPLREEQGRLTIYRIPVLAAIDWPTTLGMLEVTALSILGRRREQLSGIYAVHHEAGAVASRVATTLDLPLVLKLTSSGRYGDAQTALSQPEREMNLAELRRVDCLAAVTDDIAREARDLLGIAADRIVRVQDGVDLQRFPLRKLEGEPGKRILFLGGLRAQKCVDLLLEACSLLSKSSHPDLELMIRGDGPLLGALRVQSEWLGLKHHTTFVGRQEDVRPLLHSATVLVQPSQVEGTSNALLEALACGVPAVAARVRGSEELITHGKEGLLVPPGDVPALAEAIAQILDDPELAAQLGQAGRRRIEERHDLRQVVDQHLSLFGALQGGGTPAAFQDLAPPRWRGRTPQRSSKSRLLRATTVAGLRTGRGAVRAVAGEVKRRLQPPTQGERQGVALLVRDIDTLAGMERQATALARGLVERQLPVTIITCTAGLAQLPEVWSEVRRGARLYRVPLLLYESAAASILYRRRKAWAVIYAVQLMMGAIGARLGRLLDAPVVVKLACGGPWGDMAALRALPPADRELVKKDLKQAYLVCLSEEIRQEALAAGFDEDHLVSIPNGIDLHALERVKPLRPVGDEVTIVFAGRLDRQKGIDLLLHAFAQLHPQVPLARLLVAGRGPLREELEQVAARLGIAEHVHFLGSRKDVLELIKGATVCAVPSRAEGMSNTLLEALALGTPVVASGIAPNMEVLERGECGLIVPPDDVDAYAHALTSLLQDPALRSRLAGRGRRRVEEAYSLERVVDSYGALFDRLAAERPAPPSAFRFASRFVGARSDDLRRVLRRLR